MRKTIKRRSNCPIAFSLEVVGDSWTLLIIRDIVFAGKRTFGEFLASDEKIARNILASRLARLEELGLITKKPHPTDGRKDLYELTDAGLDFIPVLLELSAWGAKYEPETAEAAAWLREVRIDKDRLIQLIRDTVKNGGSVFAGPDNVMDRLKAR
ncbi:MAG: transcriptional regulator [Thermobacillus sp.]|jgi:DNA-binding HxlR family transcriptional regulator|uniref:winged helix-turn-helix transcriptional regulator n=1 Tax=Thermobacillus sp. TaxID=2108467 RepID=UPI000E3A54F7|nr:helix-turn-helix domain-containing protein [Thermobacillus sp.]REJ12442.1 MAG: transcriptional regulator [Paenibacillaceae bacterium]REK58829.1 MAG: transcriptional regulator [Thermobacillus sp.]